MTTHRLMNHVFVYSVSDDDAIPTLRESLLNLWVFFLFFPV
uniref:Uncharacterized protein n=1 Tax=Nelumbo nucifera TaxID=4432 RepID=A0A822Z3N6_NELNU|nr:TPA_asm: hypothetical protein HUJ06_013975 [Nelumbo nucifera]